MNRSKKRAGAAAWKSGATKPESKPWSGRFRDRTHRLVETFTSSLSFDRRLYPYDLQGSIAHCKTLERAGVLSRKETTQILRGLEEVRSELESGRFSFAVEDEDIHMAIERRLTELIGPIGGKLHTGRSRNDQVALDVRLYLRFALSALLDGLRRFQRALLGQARAHLDVVMPGYTHLQRAQPVLFSHHLLAYVEMVERDKGRVQDALARLDVMPLGSGALAGTNFPVDRTYTARLLGFTQVSENSLDAVSDRDFTVEVLASLSIVMMHLSRLSEELVLWASQEFQFVELPDAFCTGSSMMPQKKNPDVPELVRGKTGRVYGHLLALLTTLKGLPLSYNRDLQEDKEPLFDALDTVAASLAVSTELIKGLTVNRATLAKAAGSGYLLATELADYLVTRGVPFREAHATVGRIVRWCLDRKRDLRALTLADLRTFSDHFEKDALDVVTVEGAIERKAQIGGTARKRVEARIKALEKALA
ncbi:MAG TPA: argininosuccinate lyase [Nitrospiraceae bacterium]|nr:argininosuccinate lyase [Nitrospiraceae bacterium]